MDYSQLVWLDVNKSSQLDTDCNQQYVKSRNGGAVEKIGIEVQDGSLSAVLFHQKQKLLRWNADGSLWGHDTLHPFDIILVSKTFYFNRGFWMVRYNNATYHAVMNVVKDVWSIAFWDCDEIIRKVVDVHGKFDGGHLLRRI